MSGCQYHWIKRWWGSWCIDLRGVVMHRRWRDIVKWIHREVWVKWGRWVDVLGWIIIWILWVAKEWLGLMPCSFISARCFCWCVDHKLWSEMLKLMRWCKWRLWIRSKFIFVSVHVFSKGARSSECSYTVWMRAAEKWTTFIAKVRNTNVTRGSWMH